jgi:hypothetical protein
MSGLTLSHELWAVPFVTADNCIYRDTEKQSLLQSQLKQSLRQRVGAGIHLSFFTGLVPMDWICAWDPKVLRAYLHRLRPGGTKITLPFEFRKAALPDNAPQLGFFLFTVSLNGQREGSNSLILTTPRAISCISGWGKPSYIGEAIVDGLVEWILAMHLAFGICCWDVNVCPKDSDRVQLSLQFENSNDKLATLEMRMYQVGRSGLNRVIEILQKIAAIFSNGLNLGSCTGPQ